jgi:hypothetical protein
MRSRVVQPYFNNAWAFEKVSLKPNGNGFCPKPLFQKIMLICCVAVPCFCLMRVTARAMSVRTGGTGTQSGPLPV